MPTQTNTVVVTDANVLINFCHIGRLPLVGALTPYRFVVPAEVVNEITEPTQKADVARAIEQGVLAETVVDSIDALALFGTLRYLMGRGEAACLALAVTKGWMIASDEKRRFRREAVTRIGAKRESSALPRSFGMRSRSGGLRLLKPTDSKCCSGRSVSSCPSQVLATLRNMLPS